MLQLTRFSGAFALMGVIFIGTGWADSAHSARSFQEDSLIKKTVKGAPFDALASKDKRMSACSQKVSATKELQGAVCRLQALPKVTSGLKNNTPWLVKHKLSIAQAAFNTFTSIETYEPLDAPPKFRELQYQAGEAACATLETVMADLSAIPNRGGYKPAFQAAKNNLESFQFDKRTAGVRNALCACAKKWLGTADRAFRSMEEKGAIQRTLTSRGCFLDMKKAKKALNTSRKSGPTQLSGRAKDTADQESDEQRILDYAQTRDFTLNRCRAKIGATKIKNPEKVESCLCREIKRWRFPSRKGSTAVRSTVLPIEDKMLGVRINVDPKGKVQQCGPLEGPKAPPLKR